MFCSTCGKTIKPDDKVCAHCGAVLGDSRFEGSGYTSVQTRHMPGEQPKSERYTPYTRTTYMSEVEDDGDVYARTTYRPVLANDADEPVAEPEDEPETLAEAPAEEPEEAKAIPDQDDESPPAETDAEAVEKEKPDVEEKKPSTSRLKPVTVAGISPEVAAYAEKLKEQKGRPKKSFLASLGVSRGEEEVAPSEGEDDSEEIDGEEAAYIPRPRPKRNISRIVGMAVGALAIIVLLVGGFIYISARLSTDSKIAGVTLELYTKGIELIESHTGTDYKRSVAQYYLNDFTDGTNTASAKLDEDLDEVNKLNASEKPLENDQLFVNVLARIQNDIAEAISAETVSQITQDTSTKTYADEIWARVDTSVTNLKNATTATELRAILSDTSSPIATPEPEASPTPAIYKTLSKGDKSVAVEKMQRRLKELGYYNGEIDGDFGTATQTQVKRYQEAIGMEATGIASPEFQERLYADDAPIASPTAATGESQTTFVDPDELPTAPDSGDDTPEDGQ